MKKNSDQNLSNDPVFAGLEPLRLRYGVDYTAGNPYQTLLYNAVGPSVASKPSSIDAALHEIAQEPGTMVYHLHWEDHVQKNMDAKQAAHKTQALIDGLEALINSGCKIVWTRHNFRPHDAEHHELHADLVAQLTTIASVVHVHSWEALEQISEHELTDLEKTVVIAHGNYMNHYPGWAALVARDSFDFDAKAHVFLLFGRLGEYKQVKHTADIFSSIDAPHARLLIAGSAVAPELTDLPNDDRITLVGQHIPDAEVGRYFAAADTVLLPYRSCLTSGTAVLANGFSRSVLGTNVAGLRSMVVQGETGLLYDDGGLKDAMLQALIEGRDKWLAQGKSAGRRAAIQDWRISGRLWRDLFHGLARQKLPGDLTAAKLTIP